MSIATFSFPWLLRLLLLLPKRKSFLFDRFMYRRRRAFFFFLLLLLLTTLPFFFFFLHASLQLSFLVSSTDYKRLCWTNQFRSFFFFQGSLCVSFYVRRLFSFALLTFLFFLLLLFGIVYFERCERLSNRASFKCINSEREGGKKKNAGTTSLFDQLYALSFFFLSG